MNLSSMRQRVDDLRTRWRSLRPSYRALMFMLWLQGLLTVLGYSYFVRALPDWYGCWWERDLSPLTHGVLAVSAWMPPGEPTMVLWTGVVVALLFAQTRRTPAEEIACRGSLALPLALQIAMGCAWFMIGIIFLPSFGQLFMELFS